MYIRRKVFSSFIDENGEERYFSTTEFEDERLYTDMLNDMEIEAKKNRAFGDGKPLSKAERQELQERMDQQRFERKVDDARARNNYNANGPEERALKAERENAQLKAKEANKVGNKAKTWVKQTYGKGAKHRGRNIAITAAVPVVATGGVIAGKRIAKNRKAKKSED